MVKLYRKNIIDQYSEIWFVIIEMRIKFLYSNQVSVSGSARIFRNLSSWHRCSVFLARLKLSSATIMRSHKVCIGDAIEVYWPDDDAFYRGRVTKFCESTSRYRVEYLDGDIELLDLCAEQWHIIPSGVSTSHLGSILYMAAGPQNVSPPSPVSIVPGPESHCGLTIITHIVNKWLSDESRRTKKPVSLKIMSQWTTLCAELCVQYVHGHLSDLKVEKDTIDQKSTRWILVNCREECLKVARSIFKLWAPPLTTFEYLIEIDIMEKISHRFSDAKKAMKQFSEHERRNNAKLIAENAAQNSSIRLD